MHTDKNGIILLQTRSFLLVDSLVFIRYIHHVHNSNYMNTVLYPRQRQILNFINQYIDTYGTAPSLTEIKGHIGVKTLSTVHEHLAKLEAKGIIEKIKDQNGLYFSIKEGSHQGSLIQVPLVGLIAAGKPILAVETLGETIEVPAEIIGKRKNLYSLRVKGDSMIESLIGEG